MFHVATTPSEPILEPSDLMPGDLLLFHRDDLLGRVMQALDGTEVCHAALFLGDAVAESIRGGLVKRSLTVSFGKRPGDYILVHRWREHRRPTPIESIVRVANAYLGSRPSYAYSEVLLLAFLAMTRKIPLTWESRALLRLVLDRAATALIEVTRSPTMALTCSEFVFRCFAEAGGPTPRICRPPVPCAEQARLVPMRHARLRQVTANFVSPGDLYRSPSFALRGRLRLPPTTETVDLPTDIPVDPFAGDRELAGAAADYLAALACSAAA